MKTYVYALIIKKDAVLVLKKQSSARKYPDFWGFPGGSGRASKILQRHINHLTVVEINQAFLDKFECPGKVKLIREDMNIFTQKNDLERYDLIFSFWGPYLIQDAAKSLFEKMNEKTTCIFFHAHRGLEEQRIVRRILHKFKDASYDPDKCKSEKEEKFCGVLDEFCRNKRITFSIEEIQGISKFRDLEFAIESFTNFHLGGVFDKDTYIRVHSFLEDSLRDYLNEKGEIELTTGMKLYKISK